ncbi:NAD-dependent epimerase/dehydratase family protein [Streptomyces sp. NPDC000983]|uniref:NAD-dependent epimerase/dehydratase family protein n=1 Tax=Streptomyces sp. NPDC000983 TaxID=3154373 RepID=UPI0033336D5D
MNGQESGPRIVVTGATGNVGSSVVRLLNEDPGAGQVEGWARRAPERSDTGTVWRQVDLSIERDDLAALLAGVDVVVHLAWRFHPARDPAVTWRSNVLGSARLFEAVAEAGVPSLVYASSVGAYSPGPKDREVDESWPTHGWPAASYTREKAYLERVLDAFEQRHPQVRVVRMRPGFCFKRESASEQRRIFAGRLLPGNLVRPDLLPVVPDLPGLRVQALHTDDAADAYRLAALGEARGPFNVAADPPIDAGVLAELFDARPVPVPASVARAGLAAAWAARLVPAPPQLLDAVLRLPLMDTTRARTELAWTPRHTATGALRELLDGMRAGAGAATRPLAGRVAG